MRMHKTIIKMQAVTLHTPLLTDMKGIAPCSHKSKHISMPELPHPTTSTFIPLNLSPLLYALECNVSPTNLSFPFTLGTTTSAFSPLATTNHGDAYSVATSSSPASTAVTRQSAAAASKRALVTVRPKSGDTAKRSA